MGAIVASTDFLLPNEPCFECAEVNRVLPIAGMGTRRFQIITVIRGDKRAVFERDMGPASDFTAEQFIIPGAVPLGDGRYEVIETVSRLQGVADEHRAYFDKPTERQAPPADLVGGFEQYATMRRAVRRGRRGKRGGTR